MTKTAPNYLVRICSLIFFVLLGLLVVAPAKAATKDTFDFQSRIVDQNGKVIADGNYNFKFIIYDAATGGNQLWSETRTLTTRRGIFSVDLGGATPFTSSIFANSENLYLKICFDRNGSDGDAGGECASRFEESFSVRKRITAVPWALRAFALGPVNMSAGSTAYEINTTGASGTIFNFQYSGSPRFTLGTDGNLGLIEGANISFGNSSLRSTDSSVNSGAAIIGTYPGNFNNISGDNVQEVLESIDDLIGTGGGSETDPVWINAKDINSTTVSPLWTFNSGIVLGNNNSTSAGSIRYTGTDFEGYNGSNWLSFTSGSGGPETDPVWVNNRDTAATLIAPAWTFSSQLTTNNIFPDSDLSRSIGDSSNRYQSGFFGTSLAAGGNNNFTSGNQLLFLDNTNDIAATTGGSNYAGIRGNFDMNTTSANGTQTLEGLFIDTEVTNAGSNGLDRLRGGRFEVTNNNTAPGSVFGMNGIRALSTNNGENDRNYAISGNATNNGNTANFLGGINNFVDNNSYSRSIRAFNTTINNDGTTDYFYGNQIAINNTGTVSIQSAANLIALTNTGTAASFMKTNDSLTNSGNAGGRNGINENIQFQNLGTFTDIDTAWNRINLYNAPGSTMPQYYGDTYEFVNAGTMLNGLFHNYWFVRNEVGASSGDIIHTILDTTNIGSANSITNISSTINTGNVSGDVYGYRSTTGESTGAGDPNTLNNIFSSYSSIKTTYYGINAGNDIIGNFMNIDGDVPINAANNVVGNYINFIDDVNGTYVVGNWVHMDSGIDASQDVIGNYVDFDGNVNAGSSVIANYVDLSALSGFGDRYGYWGYDGSTTAYINYQQVFSFYSSDLVRFDSGIQFSGDGSDRLSTYPGSQATSSLYWGDDLLCDPTLTDCGIGGGGGGVTEDYDYTYVTDTSNGFAVMGTDNNADFYVDNTDFNVGSINPKLTYFTTTQFTVNASGITQLQSSDTVQVVSFSNNIDITAATNLTESADQYTGNFNGLDINGTGFFNIGTSDSFYLQGQQIVSITGNQGISLTTNTGSGNQISFSSDSLYFGSTPDFNYDAGISNFNFAGDLNINTTGNVSIPDSDLTITNGALCVDGGSGCPGLSAGGIYGDLAYSEFDVAENILAESDVSAGDIVSVLPGEKEVVRKANKSYDRLMLGVISTNPGSLGGYTLEARSGYKIVPLTLAGRVPVKVNTSNGAIKAGDPITSSAIKGEGMRATRPGKVIGTALEDYNGKSSGTIVVFIDTYYYIPDSIL